MYRLRLQAVNTSNSKENYPFRLDPVQSLYNVFLSEQSIDF